MKRLAIVSIGMGGETLTPAANGAIEQAEALLGAPRMLAQFAHLKKPGFPAYAPDPVGRILTSEPYERFALLVSGDAGFFSAADKLCKALPDYEVDVVPGVSSLNYLFAKLCRPWQEAAILSCHGRSANLVDTVRRNSATFALTGGNIGELARQLTGVGFGGLSVTVGENLGTECERILELPVSALPAAHIGTPAVLLIDNPNFESRSQFGISDGEFIRGNVPMTKAEVRAVTMSKLALAPGAICYDVGAGTGSVTVEMALAAYHGHVYAIDKKEDAIRFIEQNCAAFHIGNVTPVLGNAPGALTGLPSADAVFIGGSGGDMPEIFDCIIAKNPSVRIVVNAIALESVHTALSAFAAHGIGPEVVQLGVSKTKPVDGLHPLIANNPVFIISGGGYA